MKLKKLLILSFVLIFGLGYNAQAQYREKSASEIKRMIWKRNDPAKKIKYDASKYKDESAVVLYQQFYFDYKKRNAIVYMESFVRRRVKILDQAALDEYSELKYTAKAGTTFAARKNKEIPNFKVKIIKPNKKEILVDIAKNSVDVDKYSEKRNFNGGRKKRKVAIPNLEIGDIVDYYYYDFDWDYAAHGYIFDPVYTSLNTDYPIIKEVVNLNLGKKFYLSFNNLKGAPDIKKIHSRNPKGVSYQIVMENVARRDAKSWVFPKVEYPSIKFQVAFAPSKFVKKKMSGFIGETPGKIKRSVSENEVFLKYKNYHFSNRSYGKLYKNLKGISAPKKRIAKFYNNLRYEFLQPALQSIEFEGTDSKYSVVWVNQSQEIWKDDASFHSILASFLAHEKIKHEILLVKYRSLGGMKDLLFKDYLQYVTKAYLPGGEVIYLQSLTEDPLFAIAGEVEPLLEGNTAYALSLSKVGKPTKISATSLPVSPIENNVVNKNIEVNIGDKITDIAIKQTVNAKGHTKDNVRQGVISIYDFVEEDYKKYHDGKPILYKKTKHKRGKSTLNKLNAKIKQEKQDRNERLRKDTEETYEVEIEKDNYHVEVDKTGRYYDQNDFEYHESFNVKSGLTKKAGRNILLLAGKLIGKQSNVDEKEMKRTENIYRRYPYTAKYTIRINIPAGYKVKGLSKFNKNVSNEVGSFISTAKLEGNKIIIHVEESYKHIYEPNANWPKMVEVLNTSNQFTQEKLLLKK